MYLNCENAEKQFGKVQEPISHNGDISVQFLKDAHGVSLETGAREYQREKVAKLDWKQAIILTILSKSYARIPQIHIRVEPTEGGGFRFEIVDGQQRVSAPLDFIDGKFKLPTDDDAYIIDGMDCRGCDIKKIKSKFPKLYSKIMEYRISCLWYENLEDDMISDLFVNILNNVNDMKEQEIRNAVRGLLSSYIRDTARFEEMHDLFERQIIITDKKGNKKKNILKHFSPSFALKGRMEVDEWLSEIIFLKKHGFENGVTPAGLTKWIKDIQKGSGDFTSKVKFNKSKKEIDELLDFSYKVITSVDKVHKDKLTPWLSMILVLYADSLRNQSYDIDVKKYTAKFFEVYGLWSDDKLKLYMNETMLNGNQMQPFKDLFGGKNKNAIGTIRYVLDKEKDSDKNEFGDVKSFGLLALDARETFSEAQILQKWGEQDGKCFFTGEELERNDLAGDHYIPRSWGIAKGGVTEYTNLVVTSRGLNLKKGARHGDEFLAELNK
jgi:hypothetical protein